MASSLSYFFYFNIEEAFAEMVESEILELVVALYEHIARTQFNNILH